MSKSNSIANPIKIALDAMGGDYGPEVVVPAAIDALLKFPNLHLILVGNPLEVQQYLDDSEQNIPYSRLKVHATTQVVAMDEKPSFALRAKKDSSMRVAINLVKDKEAQACVSAGNTGALMAISRFVLKMLPGIDRPAIVYSMPTLKQPVDMLDLGANVDCQGEHLVQFAQMASVLHQTLQNKKPKVALLNIGAEAIKGSESVKQAAEILSQTKEINYVGFVEGNDIFSGKVDVIVCDGFVGNVALKTSEGTARMFIKQAKDAFGANLYTKIIALLAIPIFKKIIGRLDPNKYNGATLLGLRSVVVKSHGSANREAFVEAIRIAMVEAQMNLPEKIEEQISAQKLFTEKSN